MKPYRLVNSEELEQFNTEFSYILDEWSQKYCLNPISLKLSLPSKNYRANQTVLLDDIATLQHQYISLVNYALFGEDHLNFYSTSEQLFLNLLNRLCKTDADLFKETTPKLDWVYSGSPCLLVELSCNSYQCSLLLNPEWVYSNLPKSTKNPAPLLSLESGLAENELELELQLMPMNLPINQLLELVIGDVIISDHQVASLIKIGQGKAGFASAELGQQSTFKSIILKEFL